MDSTRQAIRSMLTEARRAPLPGDISIQDLEALTWVLRVVIDANYAPETENDFRDPQELAQDVAGTLKRYGGPRYGGGSPEFKIDGPHPGTAAGGGLTPADFWIDVTQEVSSERRARERISLILKGNYGDLYAD